ncbi:hypothetical protein [Paraburkholderia aromaticivorans]|uniref:hypothetical protein n=1 Tax=Paraburkholderia aromaticivorans TaxID=2026199 RepID=UPI0038B71922
MAYTLELENIKRDRAKRQHTSVVSHFLGDADAWDINEDYVQGKLNDIYLGTIKHNGTVLYSGIMKPEDLPYETSQKGLEEIITYAEALKRNPLNPQLELDKVWLGERIDVVEKKGNIGHVVKSFDYLQAPTFVKQHTTNIIKYAQVSSHDHRFQPARFDDMLKNPKHYADVPRDYFRGVDLSEFVHLEPQSPEWTKRKNEAKEKMEATHSIELRMATPETKNIVEARISLERKLFNFNLREDITGNLPREGLDLARLNDRDNPSGKLLKEAFMDYQSAVIGKDWRHTYADGAKSLKVETKLVPVQPQMEQKLSGKLEFSEASLATIERANARREAEKQAEEQHKEQQATLAAHTAKVERNQPFTEEAMWSELNDNTKLSPSKLRNFLEHTHNEETRTQLLRNNGMTTGQYIESISKEIVHDDKFGLNSEISKACDLAYAYKHKTHKRERDMASLDDIPLVEAKHSFENALFTYQEAKFKGQTGWEDDFKPVLKRYQAYKEIELGRNMEIVDNLIIKGQSFHETMEQQFAYEPKKIVPEASRVARPDSKKDEPPMKLVEGEAGKSDTKAKKSVEGNILAMRQTKAK